MQDPWAEIESDQNSRPTCHEGAEPETRTRKGYQWVFARLTRPASQKVGSLIEEGAGEAQARLDGHVCLPGRVLRQELPSSTWMGLRLGLVFS